jgi:hypothetical protein
MFFVARKQGSMVFLGSAGKICSDPDSVEKLANFMIAHHQPDFGLTPRSHQHHSRIMSASAHTPRQPHRDPDATHILARHVSLARHPLHALLHK